MLDDTDIRLCEYFSSSSWVLVLIFFNVSSVFKNVSLFLVKLLKVLSLFLFDVVSLTTFFSMRRTVDLSKSSIDFPCLKDFSS